MKFSIVRMHIAAEMDIPAHPANKFTTLPKPRKKGGRDNNRANRRSHGVMKAHMPHHFPPIEKPWKKDGA